MTPQPIKPTFIFGNKGERDTIGRFVKWWVFRFLGHRDNDTFYLFLILLYYSSISLPNISQPIILKPVQNPLNFLALYSDSGSFW